MRLSVEIRQRVLVERDQPPAAHALAERGTILDRQLVDREMIDGGRDDRGDPRRRPHVERSRTLASGTNSRLPDRRAEDEIARHGKPTGRSFNTRTIADCMIFENRIYREWIASDGMGLIRQLGLDPNPIAEATAREMHDRGQTLLDFGENRRSNMPAR